MMKTRLWMLVVMVAGALSLHSWGQAPVITGFQPGGQLSWSNAPDGVVEYRVQRAETLAPPVWTNEQVGVVPTGSMMSVSVPMPVGGRYYRVVAVTDDSRFAEQVLIPAGTNSGINPLSPEEAYETPWYSRDYSLTVSSFYMDKYEVTKAKWDEVRSWAVTHGYPDLMPGAGKGTNHPVQQVNWYECVKWCNARSEKDGLTPAYYTTSAKTTVYRTGWTNIEDNCVNWSSGYRLPTATEWEYAARGGVSSKRFPWGGDTISHTQANYFADGKISYDLSSGGFHPAYTNGADPYTSPVGSFEAGKNAYGLYDMAGNVWEWCWNWYPGKEGQSREIRGGQWGEAARYCKVGLRYPSFPSNGYGDTGQGFRTVLSVGQ
ncbi:MAG: SUMF1/EgtB/PvdO family nonheme iron enzyme [bacterium]